MQHTLAAQFNAIGVLALVLIYLSLGKQRYFQAGLWAGGLLFKPQATMIPLMVILLWSVLDKRRWPVGYGFGLSGVVLWGVAEIFEPNWVFNFLGALGAYSPVSPIIDGLWGVPVLSTLLILVTLWFTWQRRQLPANTLHFAILLAWALCINALVVPLWGMLHIISMGPVIVIVLSGVVVVNMQEKMIWWLTVGLFVAGLVAFIGPIVVVGATGLQITVSEYVYRVTIPLVFAAIAAVLMVYRTPEMEV